MIMTWDLDKALDEYLDMMRKKGDQIEKVIKECVEAGQDELLEEYRKGLEPHKREGDALDSLEKKKVIIDGNFIDGDVGSYADKSEVGYAHAKYQEYGAFVRDGGTTSGFGFGGPSGYVTFVADPWKRPADERVKRKFKKNCLKIIKRRMGG